MLSGSCGRCRRPLTGRIRCWRTVGFSTWAAVADSQGWCSPVPGLTSKWFSSTPTSAARPFLVRRSRRSISAGGSQSCELERRRAVVIRPSVGGSTSSWREGSARLRSQQSAEHHSFGWTVGWSYRSLRPTGLSHGRGGQRRSSPSWGSSLSTSIGRTSRTRSWPRRARVRAPIRVGQGSLRSAHCSEASAGLGCSTWIYAVKHLAWHQRRIVSSDPPGEPARRTVPFHSASQPAPPLRSSKSGRCAGRPARCPRPSPGAAQPWPCPNQRRPCRDQEIESVDGHTLKTMAGGRGLRATR